MSENEGMKHAGETKGEETSEISPGKIPTKMEMPGIAPDEILTARGSLRDMEEDM